MDFLEKDLENIIFTSDKELLNDRGLTIIGKLLRQTRIGNYGIADLIELRRSCNESSYINNQKFIPELKIIIYELKQDEININSFLQAIGYMKGIQKYINKHKYNFSFEIFYQIILIGKKMNMNTSFSYLSDLLPYNQDGNAFLECYTYSYEIDGIHFNYECDYCLTNEGF